MEEMWRLRPVSRGRDEMNKKFEKIQDRILPIIDLPNPCEIRVEIRDGSLFLYVGPRDWQWDFEDESFVGCGTLIEK